jgi:hypothetical protein
MSTTRRAGSLLAALIAAIPAAAQTPLGTGFTYQGRLADGGTPADGPFDFQLTLFDAPVGGSQVGPIVTADDVAVIQGLFTVSPDFGAVFGGERRWLEVGVRPGPSTGPYATLSPRQELTAAPAASFSAITPWTGISGKPPGFDDDVDDDALGALACAADEVAKWDGAAWACAADADTTYSQGPGISIAGTVISVASSGITTAMILDGTLTAADLAADSVGSAEIAASAVGALELADAAVGTGKLADGAVVTAKIAPDAVTTLQIAADTITAADIVAGAVGTSEIADNAVTSADVATDTITAADIAPNAVGTSEIANASIVQADIAAPDPPNVLVTSPAPPNPCFGREFVPLVLCVVGSELDLPDCDDANLGVGAICEFDSGCDQLDPALDNCGTSDMYMRAQ